MLTIKSDDINGRAQLYEAIVKGKKIRRPNVPESFNVLLRELQALNLSIDLLDEEGMETLERTMKERFEQLEKLEGQYDIELDVSMAEVDKVKDDTPIVTVIEE